MCGRPARDPKVDAQLEKDRQAAEAAKAAAQEEANRKRQEQLEQERAKALQEAAGRQSELTRGGTATTPTGVAMQRPAQRAMLSGGRGRGRRSLLTGAGGGQGYYSRFS